MNSIAFAVIVLVVLGLAGGIILVLASKFMAVYEDPRIAQITECLAGANCGGCGYAGCAPPAVPKPPRLSTLLWALRAPAARPCTLL